MARPPAPPPPAFPRMVGLADGADRREPAMGILDQRRLSRPAGRARDHDTRRRAVPIRRIRAPARTLRRGGRAGGGRRGVGAGRRRDETRLFPVPVVARVRAMAADRIADSPDSGQQTADGRWLSGNRRGRLSYTKYRLLPAISYLLSAVCCLPRDDTAHPL